MGFPAGGRTCPASRVGATSWPRRLRYTRRRLGYTKDYSPRSAHSGEPEMETFLTVYICVGLVMVVILSIGSHKMSILNYTFMFLLWPLFLIAAIIWNKELRS